MKGTVITEQWGHQKAGYDLTQICCCIVTPIPKLVSTIEATDPGKLMALPFHQCKSHWFLLVNFGLRSGVALVASRSHSLSSVNPSCIEF